MDRSLDDTIAERRTRQPPRGGRRGPGGARRDEGPRDGIRKSGIRSAASFGINEYVYEAHLSARRCRSPAAPPHATSSPAHCRQPGYQFRAQMRQAYDAKDDREWVHDRYDDDRAEGRSRGGPRFRDGPRIDRWMPNDGQADEDDFPKIRIDNLHYDLTERDVEDVFAEAGPIRDCRILFDRQDRSRGIAIVTYSSMHDAERAVRNFHGQFAKGQRIRVYLDEGPSGRGRGAERSNRSLADRINSGRAGSERRSGRDNDDTRERGERRRRRSMSPMAVDRPARSAPGGRLGAGRRPGQRREGSRREDGQGGGRGQGGARPRKTKEQLDAEMADYFTPDSGDAGQAGASNGDAANAAAPVAQDGDVDMIE